ncbi:MAG: TIGR04283 family arsenosugar biosynthesis glycosyltransferase [Rhodospirillales bacterium]
MTDLSAIIPTVNESARLPAALAVLRGAVAQIVVADGGSTDGTGEMAAGAGATVITSTRGRGAQLAAGAEAARCDWLLFLHADTALEPGWAAAAWQFMADPRNAGRAGYFAFALDDRTPAARRLERLVAWRCRVLGLPYGDQGLLIAREHYRRAGGYRALPLMEDVDIVRRVGRRNLVPLPARAVTSAERWRREGWIVRSARNLLCLTLYFLGVPPRALLRIYR